MYCRCFSASLFTVNVRGISSPFNGGGLRWGSSPALQRRAAFQRRWRHNKHSASVGLRRWLRGFSLGITTPILTFPRGRGKVRMGVVPTLHMRARLAVEGKCQRHFLPLLRGRIKVGVVPQRFNDEPLLNAGDAALTFGAGGIQALVYGLCPRHKKSGQVIPARCYLQRVYGGFVKLLGEQPQFG